MKKRVLSCVLTGIMILTVAGAGVYAASGPAGSRYTDENGDGICDNRTEGVCLQNKAFRWDCLSGFRGQNVTDADQDGICDNCSYGTDCPGNGMGMQQGGRGQRNR